MLPTPRWRPTARLLVVDPAHRVLLFRFRNEQGEVSWLTPGGGIHRGESVEAAAVRELGEETGHVIDEASLGPVVATRAGMWRSWRGGRLTFAADTFFLVRVDHAEVSTEGHQEIERTLITGHHWWTVDELRATTEYVSPPGLGDLTAGLLAGGAPARPARLPWRGPAT
ncbi:MAG TPA: NUDIX domain-containing protein [Trebonia sp.]|jgi:8-oxo-dGTP pyrophosphatase MutT (NUDIX family)|nr:NUDIX domain-containing protein [Trebonia sp.]